jgi:hypothetical protein
MFEEFNILNFFIVFFGFFAVIVAIVMISTVYLAKMKKKNAPPDGEVIKEKEIIKEIVLVPCVYCGSLNPQTALFCSTCGAGRKA